MDHNWNLAIETSTPSATVAIAQGNHLVSQVQFTSERSQEVDLFAPLQEILDHLPGASELSQVIVGTGPGSYNGARVGIAAAQALAQVHRCKVAGLCSFEGVPDLIWAVGDARRGSFFLMKIGQEPELLEPEVFRQQLSKCVGRIGTFEPAARLESPDLGIEEVVPTAKGLLEAWHRRSPETQEALCQIPPEAFYLRPPHITVSKKKKR